MAIFPGAVATDSDLYVAVNNLSTLLTDNPLTVGATTVNASSTTGFPTVGFISIDAEIIKYTGKTATSFTGCTRGADGTTAASHALNAQIDHNVIAAHHNAEKDEMIAVQTFLSSHLGLTTAVTAAEFERLSGVTSPLQTQLNAKAPLASPTFTGTVTIPSPFTLGATSVTTTGAELNFVIGVTSSIQTQLNAKATDSLVVHLAGTETITGQKTFSEPIIQNDTSNQVVLGSGNTTTINATAPAASRTVTIPDPGASASFVMTEGAQTINGVKTLSSAPVLSANAASTPTAGSLNRDAAGGMSWAYVSQSGGVFSLIQDVNVASLSDDGTGLFTLTWATAYSGNDQYAIGLSTRSGLVRQSTGTGQTASTVQILTTDFADNPADRNSVVTVIAVGKQ